jgi:hypothetical protein
MYSSASPRRYLHSRNPAAGLESVLPDDALLLGEPDVERGCEPIGSVFDAAVELLNRKRQRGVEPQGLVLRGSDGSDAARLAPADLSCLERLSNLGEILQLAPERNKVASLSLLEAESLRGVVGDVREPEVPVRLSVEDLGKKTANELLGALVVKDGLLELEIELLVREI